MTTEIRVNTSFGLVHAVKYLSVVWVRYSFYSLIPGSTLMQYSCVMKLNVISFFLLLACSHLFFFFFFFTQFFSLKQQNLIYWRKTVNCCVSTDRLTPTQRTSIWRPEDESQWSHTFNQKVTFWCFILPCFLTILDLNWSYGALCSLFL